MLRRSLFLCSGGSAASSLFSNTAVFLNRTQRKGPGMNPYQSDGNVAESFEKIVNDIGNSMPFKVTESMYDKPDNQRQQPDHPEAYATPTSGQEAINANLSGREVRSQRTPGDKFTFDKVYDPALAKKSTCSADHYYPPPPSKAEVMKRQKLRQVWMVMAVLLIGILFLMIKFLRPLKESTTMAGRN